MITKTDQCKTNFSAFFNRPELLAIYKEALNLVNSVAIIDCPFISNIDHRFKSQNFY